MHVSEKEIRHDTETPVGEKLERDVEDSERRLRTLGSFIARGIHTCRALFCPELPRVASISTNQYPGQHRIRPRRPPVIHRKHSNVGPCLQLAELHEGAN